MFYWDSKLWLFPTVWNLNPPKAAQKPPGLCYYFLPGFKWSFIWLQVSEGVTVEELLVFTISILTATQGAVVRNSTESLVCVNLNQCWRPWERRHQLLFQRRISVCPCVMWKGQRSSTSLPYWHQISRQKLVSRLIRFPAIQVPEFLGKMFQKQHLREHCIFRLFVFTRAVPALRADSRSEQSPSKGQNPKQSTTLQVLVWWMSLACLPPDPSPLSLIQVRLT